MRFQTLTNFVLAGTLLTVGALQGQDWPGQYRQARDKLALGDFAGAISQLLHLAVEAELSGSRIKAFSYQNETIQLPDSAWTQIARYLKRIELTSDQLKRTAKLNRGVEPAPIFTATWRRSRTADPRPVRNLPLRFFWQGGAAKFTGSGLTDPNGKSKCQVQQILEFKKKQTLIGQVDAGGFVDMTELSDALRQRVLALPWPRTEIVVQVQPLTVLLTSTEKFFNQNVRSNQVSQAFEKNLEPRGFQFIVDRGATDYFINLEWSTRRGAELPGQILLYADLRIQVREAQGNRLIYDQAFANIRGVGKDTDEANAAAAERTHDIIKNRMIPSILKAILQ